MTAELSFALSNNQTLPIGWEWSSLDIVSNVFAGNPAPQGAQFFEDGKYAFVRVQDMGRLGSAVRLVKTNDYINDSATDKLKIFPKGSVLFTKSGASTLLNQRAILAKDMYVVSHIAVAIPNEGVKSEWLYYWMKSVDFNLLAHATTLPSLPLSKAKTIPVPLAPYNEQKLIVSEIEKQFSRLDEAVAALKRIKANLKRYKASVLKAAVEGKLTEEWRRANPDVEPASKLLKRILVERRRKWEEAELEKMRVKGKEPKDDKWKKRYKESPSPDTSNLPELPDGWVWTNIEQLAEAILHAIKAGPFGSSLKKSFYVPKGYKIYGQEQVLKDDPYYGDYYIDEERYKILSSCAVKPGDILISLVGTIGRVLILPKDIEQGIINPRLVKLSLNTRLIDARFFKAYLQSPYVRYLFTLVSHGGTMDILNLTILKKIPIPLPPIEEQMAVIDEVERITSIEIGLEAEIEKSVKRAERLRQSILKKAFSGRLVPQEVKNKSASDLNGRN